MSLFDSYLIVDWSAAGKPRSGENSIWIGLTRPGKPTLLENPTTRERATSCIIELTSRELEHGARVLMGFDFPLGFPAGTAKKLGLEGPCDRATNSPWRYTWELLNRKLVDDERNQNNRFDVAESLNGKMGNEPFPFWGNVREEQRQFLKRRGRREFRSSDISSDIEEFRLCEKACKRLTQTDPKSVWQLAGAGSVGSQTLTGIPRISQIQQAFSCQCGIWPFETGLRHALEPRVLITEVYPSVVRPHKINGKPKDAGQVSALGAHFARRDGRNELEQLFGARNEFDDEQREVVEREEGWILGVLCNGPHEDQGAPRRR